jgi:hypothetical protein
MQLQFTAGVASTFPIINGVSADQGNSLYFAHEIGTNAVDRNNYYSDTGFH